MPTLKDIRNVYAYYPHIWIYASFTSFHRLFYDFLLLFSFNVQNCHVMNTHYTYYVFIYFLNALIYRLYYILCAVSLVFRLRLERLPRDSALHWLNHSLKLLSCPDVYSTRAVTYVMCKWNNFEYNLNTWYNW